MLISARVAFAQDASKAEPVGETLDALPGAHRVGTPGSAARNLTLAGSAGYGYTESVLGTNDSHHRLSGRLAASVRLVPWLAFAGSLDGRWDMHDSDTGSDSGLVGDPRLRVRAGTDIGSGFALGAQATVWLPGGSAPSIELSATTLEGLVMSSLSMGIVTAALQAGFRWDNSANAIDDPDQLSLNDRLALGLSDFNAALVGLGVVVRLDAFELLAETTWEPLLGSDAPDLNTAPLRLVGGGRWQPMSDVPLKVHLICEGLLSSRPDISASSPLVVVEPRITVLAGVSYAIPFDSKTVHEEPAAPKSAAPVVAAPATPVLGSALVAVKDENGNPMQQAQVAWTQADQMQELESDESGSVELLALEPGELEINVTAEGYEAAKARVQVKAGEKAKVEIQLKRDLPVGQIRGYIRSYGGSGLAASVRIEPIGTELQAGGDGGFEVNVPPGQYQVVISMPGFREQRRRVQVQERGVTLLNVDLREESTPRRRSR